MILSSPGIFLTDFFSLDRPGAVLTETNQLTDSTVRAKRNEVIQIFATGAGPLTQPVADGAPAPVSPLAQTILAPRVFIGNEEATVEFSGLAPGYVGLWQVNAWVPDVDTITWPGTGGDSRARGVHQQCRDDLGGVMVLMKRHDR